MSQFSCEWGRYSHVGALALLFTQLCYSHVRDGLGTPVLHTCHVPVRQSGDLGMLVSIPSMFQGCHGASCACPCACWLCSLHAAI